jgi:hypothetical protein
MPHWCLSFTTWLRCWAQFITRLDEKAGGYGPDDSHHYMAMRNGLIALQNTVTTLIQSSPDPDGFWLTVAHLTVERLHRVCCSLNPAILGEPTTLMEERVAGTRAAAVTPKRPQPSGTSATRVGPNPNKKARPTIAAQPQRQQKKEGLKEGCPYRGFTQHHSLFECKVYKSELAKSNQSSSGAAGDQKG